MVKVTIGKFKASDKRIYNIYALRGYKNQSRYIYIGNHSFGTFFRFSLISKDVWINPNSRDKIGRFTTRCNYPRFFFPFAKDDIEKILLMMLKSEGILFLEMDEKTKSREYFINKYILEAI